MSQHISKWLLLAVALSLGACSPSDRPDKPSNPIPTAGSAPKATVMKAASKASQKSGGPVRAASGAPTLTVTKLVVNGRDVTAFGGCPDVETSADGVSANTIEIFFRLTPADGGDVSKMVAKCQASGGMIGFPFFALKTSTWGKECRYDPASGNGVFRIRDYPLMRRARHDFSLDISAIASDAPRSPVYRFPILTYPSLGKTAMGAAPFYVLPDHPRDFWLDWPPGAYAGLNENVPPNTSLFFTLPARPQFWTGQDPVTRHLRVFLVELEPNDQPPLRPLRTQSDLPKGQQMLIYDGKDLAGFQLSVTSPKDSESLWIWIRTPKSGSSGNENADYLEPGRAYSLQFEIAQEPYAGTRYEATRFTVRSGTPPKKGDVVADYASPQFVDWHGDWFNGHLVPANNVPCPTWGEDYLLQRRMRDQYPDLWRTVHFQYVTACALPGVTANFSDPIGYFVNLFRDRSIRTVTKVEQSSPDRAVVTLGHILGAENFHDPDHPNDRISSHPVIGNAAETVFRKGDEVILQSFGRPNMILTNPIPEMEAKVAEVRPETNQVILETKGRLWTVKPEGPARRFPAVLGEPGSQASSISLSGTYTGTYLRHRNGRPYVNWAILDFMFDFFIHTMDMRVSIERYSPPEFVGDATLGKPSAAGWQIVSDCEYFFVRHLLRRYHADLDRFSHPIYGEAQWLTGGPRYIHLYDCLADGILRAYEEVLGVKSKDYKKVCIGLGGLMFQWHMDDSLRMMMAHILPAPLETVYPSAAPDHPFSDSLAEQPLGSNPLYHFTPRERGVFKTNGYDVNACFLDDAGKPVVGQEDFDAQGKLTPQAVSRLLPTWKHSRWVMENTRFGKGSPFRCMNVEGYGYSAQKLAKCILFEKEFLVQLDRNLQNTGRDPEVRDFLQGVRCGTIQLGLFNWQATGALPVGKPFQGTGYWPAYFADMMRRIIAETSQQSNPRVRGLYDHGTFLFDTFVSPDLSNSGSDSDTAIFFTGPGEKPQRVDVGGGKQIETLANAVTLEKDVRHLMRFIGMMTHRMAPLPECSINGHVVSGLISKYWDGPANDAETGNGPGDEHKCYVLLYDHYPPDLESQDRLEIPVRLRIVHLPKAAKKAKVTVYRVDKTHGSLYSVTQRPAHALRRDADSASSPILYTPQEIAELRKASQLPRDEATARNGESYEIRNSELEMDLLLGANRLLFVELDWDPKEAPLKR